MDAAFQANKKVELMKQGMRAWVYGAALIAFATTPAIAKDRKNAPPPASPELFEALQGCRAITDNGQRLACFDAASAKLSAAVEAKQIVVIEDKEVKKAKRTLFGFRLPDLSIFGGDGNDTEEDKTLTTTVASVRRAEGGRWNIGIPEGAVWQTTEPLQINPAVGDALEIKAGIMGGYFLKVRNKRSVRAKRIE